MLTNYFGRIEPVKKEKQYGYGTNKKAVEQTKTNVNDFYCHSKHGVDGTNQKHMSILPECICFRFGVPVSLYFFSADIVNIHCLHLDFAEMLGEKPMEFKRFVYMAGLAMMRHGINQRPERSIREKDVWRKRIEYIQLKHLNAIAVKRENFSSETSSAKRWKTHPEERHILVQHVKANGERHRSRCKVNQCNQKTQFICQACQVAMCNYGQNNCFAAYSEHNLDNIDKEKVPENVQRQLRRRS
jgi:hypothetical protein